jgi:hypothetical protein
VQGAEGAAEPGDDYTAGVRCGSCDWRIADPKIWLHSPANQRQPCPSCGAQDAWIAEIGFIETIQVRELAGLKGKAAGRKKPVFELQTGDQLEHSTGRWMRKRRLIDRDQDLYEEIVVDAETGEERHVCCEPLSRH